MADMTILNHCERDGRPALQKASDAVLIGQYAAHGDTDSFAELVDRYGRVVLGVGKRVLGSQADAEDVFQATFMVLARKAGQLDNQAPLGHWLYRVAFRIASKMRIQNARRREHERRVAAEVLTASSTMPADSIDDLRPVFDQLNNLPHGYRALIILCHLQGKSHQEAARALGWRPGSVSYRIGRARVMLRDRLARRGICVSAVLLAAFLTGAAEGSAVSIALRKRTIDTVRSVGRHAFRSNSLKAGKPVSAQPLGSAVLPRLLRAFKAVPTVGWLATGLIVVATVLWFTVPWNSAGAVSYFGWHVGHFGHPGPVDQPPAHQ
jgi:RNA polymerase sigma-70 factor (ECF subfamily)